MPEQPVMGTAKLIQTGPRPALPVGISTVEVLKLIAEALASLNARLATIEKRLDGVKE